jgi:TRAP transporter T-component
MSLQLAVTYRLALRRLRRKKFELVERPLATAVILILGRWSLAPSPWSKQFFAVMSRLAVLSILWVVDQAPIAVPVPDGPASRVPFDFLAHTGSPGLPFAPPRARFEASDDPDELYGRREDLTSARRAADLWQARSAVEYESAWKLSRVCYWLGTHGPQSERRAALERGLRAGEAAARTGPERPEGHFWLAANMGRLAESFGIGQGIKYRGRIRDELERVIAIDPMWQGGSADAALGQWYFEVPRIFGGNRTKAEEHLRRALTYDSNNRAALSFMIDLLLAQGRRDEARPLLRRSIDAPINAEWVPEDNDYKQQAIERLRTLDRR